MSGLEVVRTEKSKSRVEENETFVVRFAGDSGDGIQIIGDLFTNTSALMGESLATLPDYPSEIRAPSGTTFGVSGFQVCIGGVEVYTPGDNYDVLLALNPAALKVNLPTVAQNGVIIVNEDMFNQKAFDKAGIKENPLLQPEMAKYRLIKIPMTTLTVKALETLALTPKDADRCKNFFALGVLLRLFNRKFDYAEKWIANKFKNKPLIAEANLKALHGGRSFVETSTDIPTTLKTKKDMRKIQPGNYRTVTGNTAAALGLIAAAQKANLKLFLGSYPITPATDILHELVKHKEYATVFQAEDEIAAIGAAIGASFGGALAVTTTSGPGFSLKAEAMNLAVMVELPLIIVDVQRAGPSTGIPTKTEQSDLFQALWGRHGESPVVVMAATSPKDCFDIMLEAAQIAIKYMTPVIVLSEGYLGNGSEIWRVPELDELKPIDAKFTTNPENYKPYMRDPATLGRPWVIPGTPKMEHRLGGLEKEDVTGTVSQSPLNHEKMVKIRAEKVAKVAQEIPPTKIFGAPDADLLVLGWGGTEGVIKNAVRNLQKKGVKVACTNLRYLNPLPPDLKAVLKKYKKVLVPENNSGQLWYMLRGEYLIDTERFNKIQGQPFRSDEIEHKIMQMLGAGK